MIAAPRIDIAAACPAAPAPLKSSSRFAGAPAHGHSRFTSGREHVGVDRLHPALVAAADAAQAAFVEARRTHSRVELEAKDGMGADGTPTMVLDRIVDAAVLAAIEGKGVNLLSEEVGWVDAGSAVTLVVDPVDGTANAAAGVPIACFSGAIAIDGALTEGLTRWLETGTDWAAARGELVAGGPYGPTSRRGLAGAEISLLRPQKTRNQAAWWRIAEAAARIRVFSCSTLESALVCTGAVDAFVDAGGDVHRIMDLAATLPIAAACGAVVVDAFGRPIEVDPDLTRRWSGVVAATEELAAEIQAAIAT
jgi:myo-inositol-1(or 4)-monophosphatase